VDLTRIPIEGKGGLLAALARVPDTRDPHGKRHRLAFILAVAACGVLSGMRGYHQVAQFAAALPAAASYTGGTEVPESATLALSCAVASNPGRSAGFAKAAPNALLTYAKPPPLGPGGIRASALKRSDSE